MMGLLYLSLGGVVLDRKDAEDTVAEQDQAVMSWKAQRRGVEEKQQPIACAVPEKFEMEPPPSLPKTHNKP